MPDRVGVGRALPHLENNVTKSIEIHEETEARKGWIASLGTSNGQVTGWDWNSGCLFPDPPPDTVLLTKSTLLRKSLRPTGKEENVLEPYGHWSAAHVPVNNAPSLIPLHTAIMKHVNHQTTETNKTHELEKQDRWKEMDQETEVI